MRKLELLSPAGDMERLEMAVAYGADAVYFAGTSFGMRSFAGNFSPEELPKAVRYAHDHGVRCHVTVNTMPRNDEIVRLPEYLEQLDDAGVDALIVADLGAFTLAGKYAPHCERHISTQQSIANYVCAQAWFDLGAKRVVLARECSLEEIRAPDGTGQRRTAFCCSTPETCRPPGSLSTTAPTTRKWTPCSGRKCGGRIWNGWTP